MTNRFAIGTTATGFAALFGISSNALAQAPPPPPPPPPPPAAVQPAPATAPPPAASAPTDAAGTPLSLAEALQTTLRLHPAIQAARADLAGRKAEVGLASGDFDPLFTSALSHTHDVQPVLAAQRLGAEDRLVTDSTELSVGGSATTKWGTTIAPSVGLTRLHQRLRPPVTGVSGDPVQQAQVGLAVIQRLLRGAGSVGAASAIDSARLAERAAEHAVAQSAQIQALATVQAYWDLVAATDNLALLRQATELVEKLVADTTELVEGNQRPRADLRQLEANLATRRRDVIDAENAVAQAVLQLQALMGLGADRAASFRPVDQLPTPHAFADDPQALTRTATEKRNDVKAARRLVGSAAARLRGDEFNTKPALDLSASIGYAGALDDDGVDAFFLSTGRNVEGVNASIGLSFELPFNNTAQSAQRDFSRARYDQARIAAANLERTVPINVASALTDLRLSAASLEAAEAAVTQYEQALSDEQDKLREGVGTVLDLRFTQDLLIQARLSRTELKRRYATALARLRFETGTLPSDPAGAPAAVRTLTE